MAQLGENFTSILRETLESYELRQRSLSLSSSSCVSPNLSRKLSDVDNDDEDLEDISISNVRIPEKMTADHSSRPTLNDDLADDAVSLAKDIKKTTKTDEKFSLLRNGDAKDEHNRRVSK